MPSVKIILFLTLLLFQISCSATNQNTSEEPDSLNSTKTLKKSLPEKTQLTEKKPPSKQPSRLFQHASLPPISFYMDKSTALKQYSSQRSVNNCSHDVCKQKAGLANHVLEALRETRQFKAVAEKYHAFDYALHVTIQEAQPDNQVEKPGRYPRKIRADFTVAWKNIKIAEYSYSLVFNHPLPTETHSTRQKNHPDNIELYTANQFVTQFVTAAVKDKIFHGQFLFDRLAASNYQKNLQYPEFAGDFTYADQYTFHHPLQGIKLNYIHSLFSFDKYAVFIYPIRQIDWSNAEKVLTEELHFITSQVKRSFSTDHSRQISIRKSEKTLIQASGKTFAGRVLELEVTTPAHAINSYIYLFSQQDKFIKFRISFRLSKDMVSEPDHLSFVKAILPALEVPHESAFMQWLRINSISSNAH